MKLLKSFFFYLPDSSVWLLKITYVFKYSTVELCQSVTLTQPGVLYFMYTASVHSCTSFTPHITRINLQSIHPVGVHTTWKTIRFLGIETELSRCFDIFTLAGSPTSSRSLLTSVARLQRWAMKEEPINPSTHTLETVWKHNVTLTLFVPPPFALTLKLKA